MKKARLRSAYATPSARTVGSVMPGITRRLKIVTLSEVGCFP